MRFTSPSSPTRLEDSASERVRRGHEQCIRELQAVPILGCNTIRDVELSDAIDTPIAHGLGRRVAAWVSAPRGGVSTGRIQEERERPDVFDSSQYVVLRATGWGGTVTVDVLVY